MLQSSILQTKAKTPTFLLKTMLEKFLSKTILENWEMPDAKNNIVSELNKAWKDVTTEASKE